MKRSRLFYTDAYRTVESRIVEFLNVQPYFLSAHTAASPRAAGDAIQSLLEENLRGLLGSDHCADYKTGFSRRAMEDIAFTDPDGLYYAVDVKTHWLDADFSMPNLISVPRITQFYANDLNHFVLLLLRYRATTSRIEVTEAHLTPIEFLSWDCLTLGALGAGQIQIARANQIVLQPGASRRDWMLTLCDRATAFYNKELTKTQKRLVAIPQVRAWWESRSSEASGEI